MGHSPAFRVVHQGRVLFARCIFCKIVKAGIQELLRAELDEQREPRERAR